jgi:Domain of unknown function (DUF4190)
MSEPTPYAAAPMAAGQKTNVLAIVSLVLAFVVSLGAVITGHIALSQIKKTGEAGHGLALAGVILGYIGLAVGAIFVVIWIIAAVVYGTAVTGITNYRY